MNRGGGAGGGGAARLSQRWESGSGSLPKLGEGSVTIEVEPSVVLRSERK